MTFPATTTRWFFISILDQKEDHPALPNHLGMNDRPPQQIVRHCGSCIIAPITIGSCINPKFYRGTICHRKWARGATPTLLCHRVDESLLIYTAVSLPRNRGVPPMDQTYSPDPKTLTLPPRRHSAR
ncbi:hypothetical protein AVEN_95925-1 [Araneus ventricosus]|uniref:Uncharacterized protein n=1 Tax=Araneus ventricosus TaxID=182803 RepID=A0A4Y2CC41_ARAVE|nr:hypothetical protein AVEN_95925-1 [Araneus ventricosus]